MNKNWLSLIIFLSLSMITFSASAFHHSHGSKRIKWRVSGTIANVQLAYTNLANEFVEEPGAVISILAKGPPGGAHITVVGIAGDIVPPPNDECGDFFKLLLVKDDLIAIFADQSMLFATFDESKGGFLCLEPPPQRAESHLNITGGTGRFQGATGELTGTFIGAAPGPTASGALLWETGTIVGTINR